MVFDLVQATAFPDQPAGRPILGTVNSVKSFKSAHLKTYLSTHYQAPNMVLAAAGAVDHEKLLAAAERLLGSLGTGTAPEPSPALYRGGVARSEKPFEQTHLVLAFEAPPYRHADYFAAQVCAGALGGGMSSRLFQEVREKRGLCYAIHAFASGLSDAGMFAIYAACGPDRADGASPRRPRRVPPRRRSRLQRGGGRPRQGASSRWVCLPGWRAAARSAEQLARQLLIHGRPLTTRGVDRQGRGRDAFGRPTQAEQLLASSPISLATVGPIVHVAEILTASRQNSLRRRARRREEY